MKLVTWKAQTKGLGLKTYIKWREAWKCSLLSIFPCCFTLFYQSISIYKCIFSGPLSHSFPLLVYLSPLSFPRHHSDLHEISRKQLVHFVFCVSLSRSSISLYILLSMYVRTYLSIYLFLPGLLKPCFSCSAIEGPPKRPVLLARISTLPWQGFSFYFLLPIVPSFEVAIIAQKVDNGYFTINNIMFFLSTACPF